MKKIFIKHNGCLNLSFDFNIAKSGLVAAGYEIVSNPKQADEIIFAGCGVRAAWVDDAISQMNIFIAGKTNPKVIVTGCISKIETERIEDSVKSSDVQFKSFKELVKDYTEFSFELLERGYVQNDKTDLEGDNPLRKKITPKKEGVLRFLDQLDRKYGLDLVQHYRKTTKGFFFYNEIEPTEMITVSRSCLYKCAFCTIPKGRGKYSSIPLQQIKDKIQKGIEKGIYRFILIGDEVGNYGKDLKDGNDLTSLITEIMELNEKVKIAIRYIEPSPFYKHFETIKKYCLNERIYLLHIPLQTGSQELLKEMNRNHSLEKVVPLYKYLIENSKTAFYCNWMIGFPGESEEDFQETIKLAQHLQIQLNTVIPFSARPDTAAFIREDKVPEHIIRERCNRLEDSLLNNKIQTFKKLAIGLTPDELIQMEELISDAEFTRLKKLYDS